MRRRITLELAQVAQWRRNRGATPEQIAADMGLNLQAIRKYTRAPKEKPRGTTDRP